LKIWDIVNEMFLVNSTRWGQGHFNKKMIKGIVLHDIEG